MWQPQSCITPGCAWSHSKISPLFHQCCVSCRGIVGCRGALCKPSTKLLWSGPGQQLKCPAGFAVMESGSDSRMVLPVMALVCHLETQGG